MQKTGARRFARLALSGLHAGNLDKLRHVDVAAEARGARLAYSRGSEKSQNHCGPTRENFRQNLSSAALPAAREACRGRSEAGSLASPRPRGLRWLAAKRGIPPLRARSAGRLPRD